LFIALFPFIFVATWFSPKHRHSMRQRLGGLNDIRIDETKPLRVWLHAASVGEVQAARALIPQIRQQLPEAAVVLSVVTSPGFAVAEAQMSEDVVCIYAPLDLVGIVDRALRAIRPTIYVCLETELWPAMIRQAHRQGVLLLLLNGRLTERSFSRYRKIQGFMAKLLGRFSRIAVIRGEDAKRFRALGANPARIRILGNAKYERRAGPPDSALAGQYRQMLALHEKQPVLVTGSTHGGEEAMLIGVVRTLQQRLPDLVWVVAPRHLRRLAEIEGLFRAEGIPFVRLSEIREQGRNADVVLVDTMGELAALYSVATYVFCGGSLVERGGHNVLEAAAWGRPVFYGPSMKDFLDAQALLEAENAGFCCQDPQELAAKLLSFVDAPEEYAAAGRRALKVAGRQQGAARKQVALLREVLHAATPA
jgi:3-deoxy-D-manno-octulosonic-acid transferase